ncbi:MAG TPA: Ig-like domain-containing protein [Candidatus Krumholzibacteria bacterium]|nr:Ig-like domain-containing protein [Candidatus Krumholzibacteria bacterium]
MLKSNRKLFVALAVAACVAYVACEDDDDGTTGPPVPDTFPPTVSAVQAIDVNHVEVTFNEALDRGTAENPDNYLIVTSGAPEDTLTTVAVALKSGDRTVSITTSDMTNQTWVIFIDGVRDLEGNEIANPIERSFAGTDNVDTTDPSIAYTNPAHNAQDVLTNPLVKITFSEPIVFQTFLNGTTWSSGLGDVDFTANTEDSLHVTLTPTAVLQENTLYTIVMTGIQDPAGNEMSTEELRFTTTDLAD